MKSISTVALAALAAFGALGTVATAQVTPTHTFETPLDFDAFSSSVIYVSLAGPSPGETIWDTELHLKWTAGPSQPASEFGFFLSTNHLASGTVPTWKVTGASLGWPATSGTFTAVVNSDMFNDTLLPGLPGLPAIFDLVMDAASGGGLWGTLSGESKIVFYLGPRATGDVPAVSLSSGGTQTLTLNGGPTYGPGMSYLVAGTASGTQPGVVLNGFLVPLQYDGYTAYSVASANQGLFGNTLGTLDGSGKATATISVPQFSDPSLAGLVMNHAMIGLDYSAGAVIAGSNPVPLLLNP
jgi:hypothetical protein